MVSASSSQPTSWVFRYGAALLAVIAATAVRFALNPSVGDRLPFVVFYFAVIPAAWHLGVGPALLAIASAALAGVLCFIPPWRGVEVRMVTDLIGVILFVAVNLVIVWFAEASRIARRRLEAEVQERVRAEITILEQIRRVEFGRDIGLALTSGPTLTAVLDRCVELTVRHLGGTQARIYTLGDSGVEVQSGHASGSSTNMGVHPGDRARSDPEDHPAAAFQRGLIGRIASERRAYLTNSLVDDSGLLDREWIHRENMRAMAGCPLVVEGRLVGVWALFSQARLSDTIVEAMESVASSLALGIERKRAEESRRIGEARKAAILKSSLDGIVTMNHQGRVVEFNPAAEQIFGRSADSVQGLDMAEVIMPPRLWSAHRHGLAHYLTTQEGPILNRRVEVSALRADGSEFPAELTVTRIPLAGPPLFTAHIRDIGDRKEAEEALQTAKRDAEAANQAKDRFLAVLSHELRTPLNPIYLMINSLLGKTAQNDELRNDLELIHHYVGLEAQLIDDLLDVMRIARGDLRPGAEVVDAHRMIEQAVATCREDLQTHSLPLTLDLQATHSTIPADPVRICQVLCNLIRNAVKFTPVGGAIGIHSRNEPIGLALAPADEAIPRAGGGSVASGTTPDLVIEVTDTGIGIEPDVLPRIFDAFQQGDSATVRRFGGLGLGLAICKGIIEGQGGMLSARSAGKDQGTTLTVRMRTTSREPTAPATLIESPRSTSRRFTSPTPRAVATQFPRTDPARDPQPTAGVPLQVLVIEDEPATIRLMSRLLKGLGYQVTSAETVAEAIQHIDRSQRIDLIVSDIGLPDGTGLDLMRRVRATRGEVPGIALTGFGTEDDIEQSRLAGFSAHMTKPIDFNQLENLIRLVVGPSSLAP